MNKFQTNPEVGTPLFPVNPYQGTENLQESLASWLYRFCQKNGYLNLHSFTVESPNVLGQSPTTDAPHDADLRSASIARRTGIPVEIVKPLLLNDSLLILGGTATHGWRWLQRVAGNTKRKISMRHAICPLCVSGSPDPFWMRSWRLVTTTQCHVHNVMLLDECPRCSALFVIHDLRTHPLDRCESCNTPFSQMSVEKCGDHNTAPSFAMHVGHNIPSMLPIPQHAEFYWWEGLRRILTLIEDPQRAEQLIQPTLPAEFCALLLDISQDTRSAFNSWPIYRRHSALRFLAWLTTAWPSRFTDFLQNAAMTCLPAHLLAPPPWQWFDRALYEALFLKLLPHIKGRRRSKPLSLSIPAE